MATVTPPLKWPGGKCYVAPHVWRLAPRHLNYVEPFAGGLQVLFARDPMDERFWWTDEKGRLWKGVNEVIGDSNGNVCNFYEVVRDLNVFPEFRRQANLTPFDELTWEEAKALWEKAKALVEAGQGDRVTRARAFFTCCRLSLAGRMQNFTGMTKNRLRGGRGNEVNAFLNAVEGLPEVHARLRNVQVLHRDAVEVIRKYDVPGTFIYCDPPYLHSTRAARQVYEHEMTDAQHQHFLDTLLGLHHAKVMVSGYASPLYDTALALPRWRRVEVGLANHAAGGKTKRRMTEVLWMNYDPEPGPAGGGNGPADAG
jgi:DNA adenine methylase